MGILRLLPMLWTIICGSHFLSEFSYIHTMNAHKKCNTCKHRIYCWNSFRFLLQNPCRGGLISLLQKTLKLIAEIILSLCYSASSFTPHCRLVAISKVRVYIGLSSEVVFAQWALPRSLVQVNSYVSFERLLRGEKFRAIGALNSPRLVMDPPVVMTQVSLLLETFVAFFALVRTILYLVTATVKGQTHGVLKLHFARFTHVRIITADEFPVLKSCQTQSRMIHFSVLVSILLLRKRASTYSAVPYIIHVSC